jgi:two-component system, OmpR family, response regulator ChvI
MVYRLGEGNDPNDQLRFSEEQIDCCVSFIDMISSTTVTASIGATPRIAKYYSIFINNLAVIGKNYRALITKVAGDSLTLYFPQTSNKSDTRAFKDVIECGLTMSAAFHYINSKMSDEQLPSVNYRISSDYGRIYFGVSHSSSSYDIFGHPMNICSEINRLASPNSMIIGDNLHKIIKSFPSSSSSLTDYQFEFAGNYLIGHSNDVYPVFSVARKQHPSLGQDQDQVANLNAELKSNSKGAQIKNFSHFKNILLVDDDLDILWTYKALLECEGYKVSTFNNSEQALKNFSQSEPSYYDLVLLDIRMPHINGLQLFYRMKSINKDIRIIFVSALDAAEELISILPGIKFDKHIIKKPIGRELFVEKINAIMSEP